VVPLGTEKDVKPEDEGPIDPAKDPVKDIRQTPLNLVQGFEWCDCDVDDEKTMRDIYQLLAENYVEDDDNMFRFDYSIPFLRWALKPPGYRKEWHLGVRKTATNELQGFITAIPCVIRVHQKVVKMVEINFLCVHHTLRKKRLAPVLIREITRRVNVTNCWQAVYTAGVLLPSPIATCRYYHRPLNPKKLIAVGFTQLKPKMTMSMTIKLYKLPASPQTPGIRPMTAADIPAAYQLLKKYLEKFKLVAEFTEEEFHYWMLPKYPDVVYAFVVEDPETKQITDFVSFYTLCSSILNHSTYKTLRAAYAFYTVPGKHQLKQLMNDALILANNHQFDVFNCLDIMENQTFLKDLKFGPGDGYLRYYLYNWRAPQMKPEDIGLIML